MPESADWKIYQTAFISHSVWRKKRPMENESAPLALRNHQLMQTIPHPPSITLLNATGRYLRLRAQLPDLPAQVILLHLVQYSKNSRSDPSFNVGGVEHVRMPYFYGGFLLNMQRGFLVGVLGQLDAHDFVAPGAGTRIFVHGHLRGAFGLVGLALVLRPVELKGVVLQLPATAGTTLNDTLKRSLRVGWFGPARINIRLLHILKGRLSIAKQRSILVMLPKMMRLRARHPVRHILTILAKWLSEIRRGNEILASLHDHFGVVAGVAVAEAGLEGVAPPCGRADALA